MQENGWIITLSKIMLDSDKCHVFSLIYVGYKGLFFFKDMKMEGILVWREGPAWEGGEEEVKEGKVDMTEYNVYIDENAQ